MNIRMPLKPLSGASVRDSAVKPRLNCGSRVLGAAVLVAAIVSAQPAHAQLQQSDFTCTYGAWYNFVWDGWTGNLALYPGYPGVAPKGYLYAGGKRFNVRYEALHNPQDYVDGYQGPGYLVNSTARHRIVLWVDFNNTPYNTYDDQRFDGYLMTQTRNAIAGETWWNGMVFGFYATRVYCIPG